MSEPLTLYRFTAVWPSWGSNPVSGTIAIPADALADWVETCQTLGWRDMIIKEETP